jgi:hypothetical protein
MKDEASFCKEWVDEQIVEQRRVLKDIGEVFIAGATRGKQAATATNLDSMSKRLSDEENGNSPERVRQLEEKCTTLLQRIEELSRQVDDRNLARKFEQNRSNVQLSRQQQDNEPGKPPVPNESSREFRAELNRQLESNLAELKNLVQKNPACYINPSATTIINVAKKIATKNDRQYCACNNITLVRDMFYCTGCKQTSGMSASPCCKVSAKQGFHRWLAVRKNVDETVRINKRIDELRRENQSLQNRIRAITK